MFSINEIYKDIMSFSLKNKRELATVVFSGDCINKNCSRSIWIQFKIQKYHFLPIQEKIFKYKCFRKGYFSCNLHVSYKHFDLFIII